VVEAADPIQGDTEDKAEKEESVGRPDSRTMLPKKRVA